MPYSLTHADPNVNPISIPPLTVDNKATTSLYFSGRGVPNYGEGHQTNFLRLLENFASSNPPSKPLAGQLWFSKDAKKLFAYDGNTWTYVAQDAIYTSNNPPASGTATEGQLWYNPSTNVLKAYSSGVWRIPGACVADVGANPPVADVDAQTGQMWYDTNARTMKMWNGTRWVLTIDESLQYLALLM